MHLNQSISAFKQKKNWLYNRGFDQNASDRTLSNKDLAAELQQKYLKHFELISQGRWNVLLDYASGKCFGPVRRVHLTHQGFTPIATALIKSLPLLRCHYIRGYACLPGVGEGNGEELL